MKYPDTRELVARDPSRSYADARIEIDLLGITDEAIDIAFLCGRAD